MCVSIFWAQRVRMRSRCRLASAPDTFGIRQEKFRHQAFENFPQRSHVSVPCMYLVAHAVRVAGLVS